MFGPRNDMNKVIAISFAVYNQAIAGKVRYGLLTNTNFEKKVD